MTSDTPPLGIAHHAFLWGGAGSLDSKTGLMAQPRLLLHGKHF